MSFEIIETQEQLDAVLSKRLERERRTIEERYADYDALRSAAADHDAKVQELNTLLAEANEKAREHAETISGLNAKLGEYETNSEKMRIADELGVPQQIAATVKYENAEKFREDLGRIAEAMSAQKHYYAPRKNPGDDTGGNGKTEAFRGMLKDLNI